MRYRKFGVAVGCCVALSFLGLPFQASAVPVLSEPTYLDDGPSPLGPPRNAAAPDGTPRQSVDLGGGEFHPILPARILDTRAGVGAPQGRVGAGSTIDVQVAGAGGVPSSGVAGVILNLTGVSASADTYVTAWPTGSGQPTTSNLNLRVGETLPNLVQVGVGANGRISLSNAFGDIDMIADVAGWIDAAEVAEPGALFHPVVPFRLLDTRTGTGAPLARVGAGQAISLRVAGVGSIPADVAAVTLNVTAAAPTADTFVTAWPSGQARPDASNLNLRRGETRPNRVVVAVGSDGTVELYNHAGEVDLLADIGGWFSAPGSSDTTGTAFRAAVPARVLDTRSGVGAPPSPLGDNGQLDLQVTGTAGIPAVGAEQAPVAVVLNLTATNAAADSYLSAWPAGTGRPDSSDVNVNVGTSAANLTVVKLSPTGAISIFGLDGPTDIVADVFGWYYEPLGDPADGAAPAPGDVSSTSGPPLDADGGGAATGAPGGSHGAIDPLTQFVGSDMPLAEIEGLLGVGGGAPELPTFEPDPERLVATTPAPSGPQDRINFTGQQALPITSQGFLPYNSLPTSVGRVFTLKESNGVQYWSPCSGAVIARNLVLTAAHCTVNGLAYAFYPDWFGVQAAYGYWLTNTAIVHTAYQQLVAQNAQAAFALDYSMLVMPANNLGYYIGDYVGTNQVLMDAASLPLQMYSMGYPAEGWWTDGQGSRCSYSLQNQFGYCEPWYCWSSYSQRYDWGGGWSQMGWGCQTNGGNSGGPVFAQHNGRWYIVSVLDSGGLIETYTTPSGTTGRWWGHNAWGPSFRPGWFDAMWLQWAVQ